MTPLSTRSAVSLSLLAIGLVALTGCTDLPTGTESFQLEADGVLWTAVVPPTGLPDPETWLAYASASAPEALDAREAVASLQLEAARARSEGKLDRADQLLVEAARRAVGAMETPPGPGVFLDGIAALDEWQRSVRSGVDLTRAPALEAAVEAVQRDREVIEAALREGDQTLAAFRLTRAAERVRDWAPQGVALRVLGRVETRLGAASLASAEAERAAHLMQSAREELLSGEPLRAVQRALYALQLAAGSQLHEIPSQQRSSCGEYAC